jgi:hypothetical protein
LFQVIFCHGHQQYVYFFAALYLLQNGGSELFCSDGLGDPLHLLLEGALGQQAACQLWFHFEEDTVAGVKYVSNRAGRTSWRLFPLPVIENSGGDGTLADGLAKKSSVQTFLAF